VLNGARLVQFVSIRKPIRYSGESGLVVVAPSGQAKGIGPVANLAIGRPLRDGSDYWLLHCDRRWRVLGVQAGFAFRRDAENRAERIYPGSRDAWERLRATKPEALAYERKVWEDLACSFCRRIPPEFGIGTAVFTSGVAIICSDCIQKFHESLHRGG
jgi:hypothetical protein